MANTKLIPKQSRAFRKQLISGNTNQVEKLKIEMIERAGKGNTGKKQDGENLRWEFYMNFIKNNANIIEFYGDKELSERLNRMRSFMSEQLFWNGSFAVKLFKEKLGIYDIVKNPKRSIDGFLKSADCKAKFGDDETTIEAGVSGAFMQTDVYKFPDFLFLDVYLNKIISTFELIEPDLQNSLARLLIMITDDSEKNDELRKQIESLTNTDSLIKVINADSKFPTQDLKSDSINDKLWDNIHKLLNFMYQMRGRRTNVSEKASGVAQEEVVQNNEQFDVVVNDRLIFWEEFCDELSKATKKTVKVRRKVFETVDDDKDKEKESEPNENKSKEQPNK